MRPKKSREAGIADLAIVLSKFRRAIDASAISTLAERE